MIRDTCLSQNVIEILSGHLMGYLDFTAVYLKLV